MYTEKAHQSTRQTARSIMAAAACALALAVAGLAAVDAATLSLPSHYGSSMVFQHGEPAVLWGNAAPGAVVTVALTGTASPGKATGTASASGVWTSTLAPQAPSLTPATITVSSPGAPSVVLEDVLFGMVFLCSGQSNMELSVSQTLNASDEIAAASGHSPGLRIFQVAMLQSYCNVSTPQDTLTASIPWGRPSAPGEARPAGAPDGAVMSNVSSMSAMCFYFGVEIVKAHPEMPVGMMASSWGGTPIEVWMTPDALRECGEGETAEELAAHVRTLVATSPDPGLGYLTGAAPSACTVPSVPSTLWNTMINPLLKFKLSGFLWYQGESNSGAPERYAKCFPAKISHWRAYFGLSDSAFYVFAQIAPWPNHDIGVISGIRYAQLAALDLPGVGMAVTADIGDPAGVYHPIHPPYKQEVGRRAAITAESLLFGNASVPARGPTVTRVGWDDWNPTWDPGYHHGTPGPGTVPVCNAQGWVCGGLQVEFDRPVELRNSWGLVNGMTAGFELFNNVTGNAAAGETSAGDRRLTSALCVDCSKCVCSQPLSVSGMVNDRTIQLNTTFISGTPSILKYAFADYPTMLIFGSDGRPAEPFNVTVPFPRE